jgi:E3 SUMO-protein ligase RanBP2
VFGSKATPKKDGEESDGDDAEDDGHDPHFEPIVPLPELVTVTTGEEGQEIVFKHRAKVYRFDPDTKQWKERGVGDIKILKQPETFKYRVLLRRDQIHKIACNHLIQADIELKPLSNSETAWCWYAMDFTEDEVNGKLEHLAVRFKHLDTAKEFKAKFVECQEDIKARKNQDTSLVEDGSSVKVERAVLSPAKKTEEETAEEEEDVEDDEEDYEGDEDYNDLETIMFQQQAFLSQKDDKSGDWIPLGDVDLRILYDDDVYGARIVGEGPSGTEEEDTTVCNHLIAMQTNLSDDLTWSALDFSIDPPNYRTFKAQFESEEATSEFRDMFAEGKDLAEQSEILEQPGGLEGDPQDFYYGVGGDDEGQDS